jgi:hypothetical protein
VKGAVIAAATAGHSPMLLTQGEGYDEEIYLHIRSFAMLIWTCRGAG